MTGETQDLPTNNSKGFRGAPFGSQSSRFDIAKVHPKWRLPGTFTQVSSSIDSSLGPGHYDVLQYNAFSDKSVEARAQGPDWKRAYDVSEMSKIPHLLYREQYQQKMEQKKKLGPGTYNVGDFLSEGGSKTIGTRGLMDSLQPRFRSGNLSDNSPGPGCYGKDGIPQRVLEEKAKQSFSKVGLLENGGKGRSLPEVGTDVGPGTYEVKSFAQETINKRAGKRSRGPYEVFSLDRNKPIITGHYAVLKSGNLGPGQYSTKDSLADMNRPERRNHGKFLQMEQFPARPHDRVFWMSPAQMPPDPKMANISAATYHPSDPNFKSESFSKKEVGFQSNCSRQDKASLVFFTKNFNQVGPGRYDIQKTDDSAHVNAHTNDFLSKTNRGMSAKTQQVYAERLRAKDIPAKSRFHVDHYPTQKEPRVNIQPLFDNRPSLKIM